jgi:uncharacterized protein (UPF0335 family)
MSIGSDLIDTVRRLSALEMRTEDALKAQQRIEEKLNTILEKIVRLEERYDSLRSNVKSEIMGDIKSELVRAQVYLDLQAKGLLNSPEEKR